MIFDELGLPRDTGATDFQDSARLAGIMTVFGWPQEVRCSKYVVAADKKLGGVSIVEAVGSRKITSMYVRHPNEYKYDFSRDQAICLMAGLYAQRETGLVGKLFINGKDFFSPSHNGHVRICQGLKTRFYQNLWLMLDILYFILFTPKAESNQLLCMLMVHPNKRYLKSYLKFNKHWKQSITDYWCSWREEERLARHMISVLEKV